MQKVRVLLLAFLGIMLWALAALIGISWYFNPVTITAPPVCISIFIMGIVLFTKALNMDQRSNGDKMVQYGQMRTLREEYDILYELLMEHHKVYVGQRGMHEGTRIRLLCKILNTKAIEYNHKIARYGFDSMKRLPCKGDGYPPLHPLETDLQLDNLHKGRLIRHG